MATMLQTADQAPITVSDKAGKYLAFRLEGQEYGIEILHVQEIVGMMPVTHVPKMPIYVRGVVNLRGKVIPVVELRLKFEMNAVPDDARTCIIVVRTVSHRTAVTMGILVDSVSEVLAISRDQIGPPPAFGSSIETDFLRGIGKIDSRVVLLLEVDKVLSGEDFSTIEGAARFE